MGAGRAAWRGRVAGNEALHPTVPPTQTGAHPSQPVTTRSPLAPARLSRCPHVGTLPVGWQRSPGTMGLVALPCFLYLAAFQALPACWPTLAGTGTGIACPLGVEGKIARPAGCASAIAYRRNPMASASTTTARW